MASALALSILSASPATIDESQLPPPAQTRIDFDRDIKPLFESRCFRCHGPERPRSGFRLDNRAAALKGGAQGVNIIPGQSARSPLVHYVAFLVEEMEMPPPGKGEPLTPEEVGLLRAWIDQGAHWSETPIPRKTLFSLTPSFAWVTVSGDQRKFREHWRIKEGGSGGVQSFLFEDRSPEGVTLQADGRVLFNQDDYQLQVALSQRELGFVRFGYQQFREYYDDTGGFYAPFEAQSFSLGRDLYLDVGRAWFDLGLTLPDWPRLTLGYEYQFRQGTKSSLAWSDAVGLQDGSAPIVRAIYPAHKDLDEKAHIVKLDVSHEIRGVLLEDRFRAEFYNLDSRRVAFAPVVLGQPRPDSAVRYQEHYAHLQAVNTFRLEKQFKDWWLLGGGYLYSRLEGDASFKREAFNPSDFLPIRPPDDLANPIILRRESHVFNLSSLWGPWDGLTLSAGIQNEWTGEDGFGRGLFQMPLPDQPRQPRVFESQRDKLLFEETFGLRYTRIPFTVLFAGARFRQEWIDHSEHDENNPRGGDFLRDTDAKTDLKEGRIGFTLSPWSRVSLNASYRHQLSRSDYDHGVDTGPAPLDPSLGIDPSNGYPAFIRRRDIELDQFEMRLVVHPASWIKTTLKYQWLATDYRTVTDPSLDLFSGRPQPGGEIFAGNYDAHVYSLNGTLTPWRRLNLSTTFSYSDARTVTGVSGRAGVVPYQGGIFSVLSAASFILSKTTDLRASYSFSHADYRQNNQNESLPLGIVYDRHGLIAGVARRFSKNITTHLQYGFFHYDEPSFGRVNNYMAHAVFGSLNVVFE